MSAIGRPIGSVLAVLLLALAGCAPSRLAFTADDEAAVHALEEAYRVGWLANDSATVMATLAPDAVLMPAGLQPVVGDSAIRAYWWPNDGSETTIESYEIVVQEVEGSGDLAFLRGRSALEFTYRDSAGNVSHVTSEAAHLSVARRQGNGEWRIARRAWSVLR